MGSILLKHILATAVVGPMMAALVLLGPWSGAADVSGKLTVLSKSGKPLNAFDNGVVYIAGLSTPPPKEPAICLQQKKRFVPRVLPVVKGQRVKFWNKDRVQHNVFSKDPKNAFDIKRFPKDESREEVFEHEGIFKVYCNIHQKMVCDVLVLDNHYFAISAKDGTFQIKDVPDGTYKLHAWHIFGGKTETELTVAGENVSVELTVESTKVLRQILRHKNKFGLPYQQQPAY